MVCRATLTSFLFLRRVLGSTRTSLQCAVREARPPLGASFDFHISQIQSQTAQNFRIQSSLVDVEKKVKMNVEAASPDSVVVLEWRYG